MARPTIHPDGTPLTPYERLKRHRHKKRIMKAAAIADKLEDMAYDAMKREEDEAVKAAILRDFGPSRHGR